MANILRTTFSNAFSWMTMYAFWLRFHWQCVRSTIFQHTMAQIMACFRLWLGAEQATSHFLNQWWLVYRRIYPSLGLNELTDFWGLDERGKFIRQIYRACHHGFLQTVRNHVDIIQSGRHGFFREYRDISSKLPCNVVHMTWLIRTYINTGSTGSGVKQRK